MEETFNLFSVARRIKRPLILDGAMGSLLQSRGVKKDKILWMSKANITHPDKVIEIHKEYIEAGADIITTNTFRTNPETTRHYKDSHYKYFIESENFISKCVNLAFTAVGKGQVLVAGSNPPAEDCYKKETLFTREDYYSNHADHIKKLFQSGCNFILNETQSHLEEIETICTICRNDKIPYVISLFFDDDFNLLSGESVDYAIQRILKYKPMTIGFNCMRSETFLSFIKGKKLDFDWGVYLNCGGGNLTDEIITPDISPEEYKDIMKQILPYNPSFIGGCCGTTPEHTRKLKEIFHE